MRAFKNKSEDFKLNTSNEYGCGAQKQFLTFFLPEKFLVIILQSTLPESNSHKSNNRLSRRSIQVISSVPTDST